MNSSTYQHTELSGSVFVRTGLQRLMQSQTSKSPERQRHRHRVYRGRGGDVWLTWFKNDDSAFVEFGQDGMLTL